jgi:hypothetical protein
MPEEKERPTPPKPEEKKEEAPKAAPAPKEAAAPTKKGMSTGAKVGIGIGIGCLVILIAGAVIGYVLVKRAAKRVETELEKAKPLEKLEQELANLPQPEEFEELTEEGVEEEVEEVSGKIGDTLSDGKVSVTVNSVKHLDKIKAEEPYEGNEYIDANVTLKNETKEETTVFTSNFTIRDSRFNKYYIAFLEEGTLENPISSWQYIPEGEKITGNIVFEVKKGVEGLELVYKGEKELKFKLEE